MALSSSRTAATRWRGILALDLAAWRVNSDESLIIDFEDAIQISSLVLCANKAEARAFCGGAFAQKSKSGSVPSADAS